MARYSHACRQIKNVGVGSAEANGVGTEALHRKIDSSTNGWNPDFQEIQPPEQPLQLS
jgi:hypothetical protein